MKSILFKACLLVASAATVYAIAITQERHVQNNIELQTLSCGWPLEFIIEDQTEKILHFLGLLLVCGGSLETPCQYGGKTFS
jgi:hypothetical protein